MTRQAIEFAKAKGRMPVLQFLQPDELAIDPAYQRSIEGSDSQQLIRSIARNWNWDLCLPLVVSRRANGGMYVIDGQHRLEAARLRNDIAHLPCVVGDYSDAAAEAANFVHLNKRRRPLTGLDIFKAAVASGDEDAVSISRAIAAAKLELAPHQTAAGWKPGMIAHIGGIKQAWKANPHVAAEALKLLAAAYDGEILRYAGTIWPGIAAITDKQCGQTRPFDPDLFKAFAQRLNRFTQKRLRSDIMVLSASDTMSRTDAAVHAVRAVIEGRDPVKSARPRLEPIARTSVADGGTGPMDKFDLRTKGGAEFCDQCDALRRPDQVAACASAWCSLRDTQ